ncbi:MAG: GDYXXLXY domain-containing protein [Alphaproteobacteria bacterium]|nr:GDYXXLXY domain-containing protein [Alphaproteobacteria bacterium]
MKQILTLLFLILILSFFNYSIVEKEDIINHGETVYLKLKSVDPRSLMQGDYMRLGYDIARHISVTDLKPAGNIVIQKDAKGVGQFVRIYNNESLKDGEKLMPYALHFKRPFIMPDAYYFEEGKANLYAKAEYGIFKFKGPFKRILVGLADGAFHQINPLTKKHQAK